MPRERVWDEEETIILVYEYFNTKGQPLHLIKNKCHEISSFLRKREEFLTGKSVSEIFRNDAGIYMHWCRIRCVDPDTKYNGMKGSDMQIKVFDNFIKDFPGMKAKAEKIYNKYR
ncbi:hypothetical protein [Butyrivibrio sp. YAB3001]|uniref:hypothetical protein n=1 Tax=Butyrivibrio sp. YAB3001 TaxID=1520812 RepID=UPI0008F66BAC|nr:hypothetical protein [Butyrivibrio sp. YAB3001]SFC70012.1 hypothetical protein SAMN02910398_02911 [Butyrivibrio sp. YAB3001]